MQPNPDTQPPPVAIPLPPPSDVPFPPLGDPIAPVPQPPVIVPPPAPPPSRLWNCGRGISAIGTGCIVRVMVHD